jgi:hypothetical protein
MQLDRSTAEVCRKGAENDLPEANSISASYPKTQFEFSCPEGMRGLKRIDLSNEEISLVVMIGLLE